MSIRGRGRLGFSHILGEKVKRFLSFFLGFAERPDLGEAAHSEVTEA